MEVKTPGVDMGLRTFLEERRARTRIGTTPGCHLRLLLLMRAEAGDLMAFGDASDARGTGKAQ